MKRRQALLRPLLDLVYPLGRSCLACGAPTFGTPLCPECVSALDALRLPEDACPCCAVPQESCVCAGNHYPWDRAGAAFAYAGAAKALVLGLKFGAVEACADLLAPQMAKRLAQLAEPAPDVITWPPMPPARRRERGIDHARLLAEKLSEMLHVPARQLLDRDPSRQREQHTLNVRGRVQAAKHAFLPRPEAALPPGCYVLLVDDVLTTGETCRRCTELLRDMGAARVTVLCAARTLT